MDLTARDERAGLPRAPVSGPRSPAAVVVFGTALTLLLSSCGPTATQPVRVMALVLGADRVYRPQEAQLTTLEDPVALRGSVVTTLGGARIVDDPNDPRLKNASTPEQYRSAVLKASGLPPRANYIEKDGVLWPSDFHTWNMVTGYLAIERAQAYFESAGGPAASELKPIDLYYFPDFFLKGLRQEPIRNNAIFFSPVGGMLLLPFDEDLQEAPLAINAGVLAHEWSHRVFNHVVHMGAGFPEPIGRWAQDTSVPAVKLLYALEEGLADFHAVSASCNEDADCDPSFLDTSFSEAFSTERDISRTDHCMTASLRDALFNQNLNEFRANSLDYALGTIIASALFQAGQVSGLPGELQRAVLAAYSDSQEGSLGYKQLFVQNLAAPGNITLGALMDPIVAHVESPALKNALCNEILDHLKVPREQLAACPATATGGLQCRSLPEGG